MSRQHIVNYEAMSRMIKAKRKSEDLSLRQATSIINKLYGKISSSTLSRAENKKPVDLESFIIITEWLNVEIDFLLYADTLKHNGSSQKMILSWILADEFLTFQQKNLLTSIVNIVYE